MYKGQVFGSADEARNFLKAEGIPYLLKNKVGIPVEECTDQEISSIIYYGYGIRILAPPKTKLVTVETDNKFKEAPLDGDTP